MVLGLSFLPAALAQQADPGAAANELAAHEKNLASAKQHLEDVTKKSGPYLGIMAGKVEPELRKKLLGEAKGELKWAQDRKADRETRIDFYTAQISKNNQNAKMWDQSLRDYKEEVSHLESRIARLQKAITWLDGGKGNPPRAIGDVKTVQEMAHPLKEAQAAVKAEEEAISNLKSEQGSP